MKRTKLMSMFLLVVIVLSAVVVPAAALAAPAHVQLAPPGARTAHGAVAGEPSRGMPVHSVALWLLKLLRTAGRHSFGF